MQNFNLKGWRTMAIGLLLVIGPPGLSYLAGIDWNTLVGPTGAFIVSGVIMMVMRLVTSTPLGKS